MKQFRIQIAVWFAVALALATVFVFQAKTSRGQSQTTNDRRVKTTSAVRPVPSSLSPAASRNATLRMDLNWVFGAKPQRGWYLYEPLIGRLLDTGHDVASDGFASVLERWQKKARVVPTGVLDENSLYAMIAEWQGRRLKDKTPAEPGQLLTAPVADFYDPSRLDELRQVERGTYAAYKRMVAAAIKDKSLGLSHDAKGELAPAEKYLKIISAFRTREYQDKLRRESPHAGTAGLATNSPHFTGRALDLYVGGEPVETKDPNRAIQVQTPVYKWLVRNADRFGFRPYYYEPWHWEYVGK
ncbi:MAG: D-alanyl-D-alanine carboxypeptidase family protein [Acidobacteriota bacterium]|nr:D-alanyl-D-alanine carboxypeptidase family protein [Acidobacteriota bacterium]